ncbi:MAG TPA: helix-turn-helix domain-containing protein [Xanthomonadales bacterium]|nr:helix-turn-helix domain-containing protein [Xanthomonadales bacterium]
MPHVSRYKHSKAAEDKLLEHLNSAFINIREAADMNGFLNTLLTETEKIMLAKRLATIVLLEEKFSDSEISKILHLTRITVSKTRYFYEARGKGFKITLNKLGARNQLADFKKFLITLSE